MQELLISLAVFIISIDIILAKQDKSIASIIRNTNPTLLFSYQFWKNNVISSNTSARNDIIITTLGIIKYVGCVSALEIILKSVPNIYMFEYMKSHGFFDSDAVNEYLPFVVMVNSGINYAIAASALGFWIIAKKTAGIFLTILMIIYSILILAAVVLASLPSHGLFGTMTALGPVIIALTYFCFLTSTTIKQKSYLWIVPALYMLIILIIPITPLNSVIIESSLSNTHIGNFDADICPSNLDLNSSIGCANYHIEMKTNNYIYAANKNSGKVFQIPTENHQIRSH